MSFAGHYLSNHALYSSFISSKPSVDLFLIIVIPCFNEPDLIKTLKSLWACNRPKCSVEVIIVINASEKVEDLVIKQNKKTEIDFNNWQNNHCDNKLSFHSIVINNLPVKDAGVGLARKIGMDEAVRRFEFLEKSEGVIVGFDADCTCRKNYLTEIEKLFLLNKKINACSVQFEHPLEGVEHDDFTYKSIANYELYLRYYISTLKYAGHPFAYQTIGSSFAVRADVYCKQGGMNKKKAGEDFYFLQKIIPLGNYEELNTTKVFPSPRASNRVPFGTGATIQKMQKLNNSDYLTYNLKAFADIKHVVNFVSNMYEKNEIVIKSVLSELSEPLQKFLNENDFVKNVMEINNNSNSESSFKLRFFKWFNMFMVLKYMNYSHPAYYSYINITESAKQFLLIKDIEYNTDSSKELCEVFRKNNL